MPSDSNPSNDRERLAALATVIGRAARFDGDAYGLDPGERAALARLDPDGALRPHQIAALTRALLGAGIDPAGWPPQRWRHWSLIAHGMALAGHDDNAGLGAQLARAEVSEPRVTRLLTARGDAFTQALPALLRLLASHEVAPNWFQLGTLILSAPDTDLAEHIRLNIASRYFATRASLAA